MRTIILTIPWNPVSDHTLQGCHTMHELRELKKAVVEVPNG